MLPRMAAVDDVIPLATPIMTKTGERISKIPIKKGQNLYLAVYTYNRFIFLNSALSLGSNQITLLG
jgi:hypothetical protein